MSRDFTPLYVPLNGLKLFRELFLYREDIRLQSFKFVCLRSQQLRRHKFFREYLREKRNLYLETDF